MKFPIRDATSADAATIAEFNSAMAIETEGHGLDPSLIGPGVQGLFEDPANGRYWVAESDGQIIGQIMVTYEWSDWRNGCLWWIQSVYVHPDYRRQGVFSDLYRHVEALARDTDKVRGLRLYVENNNSNAQDTYLALGMHDANYKVMQAIFEDES